MAYEEKKTYEDDNGLYSVLKFVKILTQKWWIIVLLAIIFAIGGFAFAKISYRESYGSKILLNVANKDENIAGEASKYVTASDTQASQNIANGFKVLVQQGDDFITAVQSAVKAKTGETFSKKQLRSMIDVETIVDSTIIKISVTSGDKELAYAVSTSIQSVYKEITDKAFQTANFTVADSATQPELLNDSTSLLYTAVGVILGGGLAVLFIIISATLKDTVLLSEDIKRIYNINIIASVLKIKNKKKEIKRLIITDKNAGLPFIETFKLIRTKIENAKIKNGFSVFSVTSSTASEGKTTCSCNIALSLAKSGKSVILIDADLRKPSVAKTLGIITGEDEKGVYDIVSGKKTFEEAVKYVEKYNLYLLISSTQIADPSEVLASHNMELLISEAKKNFDYVIIDCPPAGVVADATILSNYTDSIIFVTAEGKVSRSQVEYALSDLVTTKADILGCIYNFADVGILKFGSKSGGYYLSGYDGYYASSYYGMSQRHRGSKR